MKSRHEKREEAMCIGNELENLQEKVEGLINNGGTPTDLIDARHSIIDARQNIDRAIRYPTEWRDGK